MENEEKKITPEENISEELDLESILAEDWDSVPDPEPTPTPPTTGDMAVVAALFAVAALAGVAYVSKKRVVC